MVEGLGDRELLTSWQPGSKGRVQEEEAANKITFRSTLPMTHFLQSHPQTSPKVVPLSGDQAFTHESCGEHFIFKPVPQRLMSIS
jgi:hypothetical protein